MCMCSTCTTGIGVLYDVVNGLTPLICQVSGLWSLVRAFTYVYDVHVHCTVKVHSVFVRNIWGTLMAHQCQPASIVLLCLFTFQTTTHYQLVTHLYIYWMKTTHFDFHQLDTHCAPSLSSSYVAIFMSVCLLICCVCHSLGRPEKSQCRTAVTYVWLVWVSWFVRLLTAKGSQAMLVLSTVEAQLSVRKPTIAKEPQMHGNTKKPAASDEPAKIRNYNGVTVLCVP